ncbi:MAG: hemolysin family protein [Maricaulaceae bacterium]|jgi:CBS domain containing-hemolysin-like protein
MSDTGPSSSWLKALKGVFARPKDLPELAEDAVNGAGAAPADPNRRAASQARVLNAARFDALRVDDVMVPRADIVAVEVETPLGELVKIFAEAAHSRMPVYRETLDEPVGVVHIKDVLRQLSDDIDHAARENGGETPEAPKPDAKSVPAASDIATADRRVLSTIMRPALYAPPSMLAADLLLRMQTRRAHMAIVVDEFGGTDGLVTLEDLVEEIVGDIEDEHDESEAPSIRSRGVNVWVVDARAEIEELETLAGRTLDLPEAVEDVDTLGGLVFSLAGRVPERGEVIVHPAGIEFEVLEADPRRVKRLVARAKEPPPPPANGSGGK